MRNSPIAPIFPEPLVGGDQPAQNGVAVTSDAETNRLNGMVEELALSLEQANKRIHRLQGERSQLTTQLEKRDQQIQELNRELGAYSNSGAKRRHPREPQIAFGGFSTTFFTSVTERVSSWFRDMRGEAWKPGLPSVETESKENGKPPLIAHLTKGNPRPVVIVLLLGLEATELDQLLQSVEKQCASQGAMPLCVVDCDAFEHLRSRSLAFEYIPPAADRDRFDSTLHWDLYLQRRLALIRRKWRPIRTIAFGKTASGVLALWSSSPFEDSELPSMAGQMSARFE